MSEVTKQNELETETQIARRLKDMLPSDRDSFIDEMDEATVARLLSNWEVFKARREQLPPDHISHKEPVTDWDIWLIRAGRGWGKTRTGAEYVKMMVESGKAKTVALVGSTAADTRKVMLQGVSGLLSNNIYPPNHPNRPIYKKTDKALFWPNGAMGLMYNATTPDDLRGPAFDLAWCDEIAKWEYIQETWDQLQFTMRESENPHIIITSTPRPLKLIKRIRANQEGKCVEVVGSTMENKENLPDRYIKKLYARYGNTRLGRQELEAEILSDAPNALWTQDQLDGCRFNKLHDKLPNLERIIIGVDPTVKEHDRNDSDEDSGEGDLCGIVVVGSYANNEKAIVLEDGSLRASPKAWAERVVSLYRKWNADLIVGEINNGGALVKINIATVEEGLPFKEVRATRGKHKRAEPVSSLYEQGRFIHYASFSDLEDEMCNMTTNGYLGLNSPDRCDALVWASTELFDDLLSFSDISKTGDSIIVNGAISEDLSSDRGNKNDYGYDNRDSDEYWTPETIA